MEGRNTKKDLFVVILFFIFIRTGMADDLADLLQDLAVQTACLGMYSTAQTGVLVTSRYDDPPDWYDPPMMANRFAVMSGNMTRMNTFYGVCFDYAQFAWDDIKRYQKTYNDAGMKDQQWYIAATNPDDPNTIILYDPVSREKATTISNGVYLRENSRHSVYAHDGATGHAWIWVQHKNGDWYWIDPTWTDNTGYVWWGIVSDGKEVQYYPYPDYCVADNYPMPAIPGENNTATPSSDSTYTGNTGTPNYNPQNYYNPPYYSYFFCGYSYTPDNPWGITLGIGKGMYSSISFGDRVEWIAGLLCSLGSSLFMPLGIGGNYALKDTDEEDSKFVMEIGLQPVIGPFYFSATYRLTSFKKSGFSVGIGFVLE